MLVGLCSVLPWRTMADLPVHATINDLKGSWLDTIDTIPFVYKPYTPLPHRKETLCSSKC